MRAATKARDFPRVAVRRARESPTERVTDFRSESPILVASSRVSARTCAWRWHRAKLFAELFESARAR